MHVSGDPRDTGPRSIGWPSAAQLKALERLLDALVDQEAASVIVPPHRAADGYWFGAGNLVSHAGAVWLCGRFRDGGDSRTGTAAGPRGVSCDIYRAEAGETDFSHVASWSKEDLAHEAEVLSIEGAALQPLKGGDWELHVSTEKDEPYPEPFDWYRKPGTGVWSIDRMRGPDPSRLDRRTLSTVLRGRAPDALHVKDPVVVPGAVPQRMLFSAHPVTWASSNTGLAVRDMEDGDWHVDRWQLVERGPVWDVAATRLTDRLVVPRSGSFAEGPEVELWFYDGAESMRRLDPDPRTEHRPRGWSCEEIGGVMIAPSGEPWRAQRLSVAAAWFTSAHGTGSSRYLKTLTTPSGIYAAWQQAQPDGSQPLVMHFLDHARIRDLLA